MFGTMSKKPPTLFEKIWYGDLPSLPVYRSEDRGVMAILAEPQELPGQLVVFPRRAVSEIHHLSVATENEMLLVTRALTRQVQKQLGAERVVRHTEGYGVPDHAHTVLVPSYERGDSDRIHHPSAERAPMHELVPMQELLTITELQVQQEHHYGIHIAQKVD
jgi:diadenosine tetraphosphate (Ap4A) HIT family hydrolase